MKMGFRWYGSDNDPIPLQHIRQIPGVTQIVGALFDIPAGEVWPRERIAALRAEVEAAGLALEVIESVNIHDDIKIGRPSRDRYIANYIATIENLAAHQIKVICYNFMPVFDWIRTSLRYELPDGSFALALERAVVAGSAQDVMRRVTDSAGGFLLPGWEPERLADLQGLLDAYAEVDNAALTDNFRYFIKAVMPVCERLDVKLAVHPDDPPSELFGLPRIVKDAADLRVIESFHDSPYHGFTICTGSLGENPDNDVPAIIREFAGRGKVPFVHARNIKRLPNGDFHESAHLSSEGSLDMYEVMRALHDTGFDGYVRPDHGRDIWGERGRPGYGLHDRALGVAYLNGLWEAIQKSG
ncbi:MAG: mannonate dehydratase [Propionibacteriaceae bacterium]|jgi:mannonate dehydratase|nr:mannonate dehydratase [Propionibacteriaceae bacterium]